MVEKDIRRLQQRDSTDSLARLELDVWNRLAMQQQRKCRSIRFTALQTLVVGVVFTLGAFAGQHFNGLASRRDVLSVFSTSPPMSASGMLDRGAP
jgi:hypothetical protein